MDKEISVIEHRGWEALATDQASARCFYEDLLDEQAVMLLPGGIALESPKAILASLGNQPWDWFKIEKENFIALGDDIQLMHYQVTAQRKGAGTYEALVTSIYRRNGGPWQLVFHQQTPI